MMPQFTQYPYQEPNIEHQHPQHSIETLKDPSIHFYFVQYL